MATSSAQKRDGTVHRHIGGRLRRARLDLGLSQRDFARRIGIPANRLAAYERGAVRLTAQGLFQIATSLGRPVSWFFANLPEAIFGEMDAAPSSAQTVERVQETMALIEAFFRIRDVATRRDVIRLLQGIVRDTRGRRT